ncbi:MAG: hypothetical protein Q4G30_04160 [Actinomycetaceae bacterium]|nr:hypothetical protein [Actinomycetaceae bacterium]
MRKIAPFVLIFLTLSAAGDTWLFTRFLVDWGDDLNGWQAALVFTAFFATTLGLFLILLALSFIALQTPGALAHTYSVVLLGITAGIFFGIHWNALPFTPSFDPLKSWGAVAIPLVMSAISFLSARRARGRQRRLEKLISSGSPHQALMHDQGYTEATWEEHSGTMTTVTLSFVDTLGVTRYVQRKLTQLASSPLANGSVILMYWDPTDPSNEKKMVFVRELNQSTQYF